MDPNNKLMDVCDRQDSKECPHIYINYGNREKLTLTSKRSDQIKSRNEYILLFTRAIYRKINKVNDLPICKEYPLFV